MKTLKYVMMIILMVLMVVFNANMIVNPNVKFVWMDNVLNVKMDFNLIMIHLHVNLYVEIWKRLNMKSVMMVMIYLMMDAIIVNIPVQKIVIIVLKEFVIIVYKDIYWHFQNVFLIVEVQLKHRMLINVIKKNVKENVLFVYRDLVINV